MDHSYQYRYKEMHFSWVYHSAADVGSRSHWGLVSTYAGGGFYQDFSTNINETKKIIKKLKEGLWITRGTRAIFLDFTVYNANLNLFCISK